jgi:hypothetical protein
MQYSNEDSHILTVTNSCPVIREMFLCFQGFIDYFVNLVLECPVTSLVGGGGGWEVVFVFGSTAEDGSDFT